MQILEEMLNELNIKNGSDLHIQSGCKPMIRVEGKLVHLDHLPFSGSMVENIKDTLNLSDTSSGRLIDDLSTDARFQHPTLGTYRTNVCHCDGGIKITMRNLNRTIKDLDSLGFESGLFDEIIERKKGLVIFTGSTNSGKSTTLASLVKEISEQGRNIITLEDPIEYIFDSDKSVITQREFGINFRDFPTAISTLLRMDPDVILVGEMRDKETIRAALLLAETGHLVLTTTHTTDIESTLARIILPFDYSERNEIAAILKESLTMIVAQQLIYSETEEKLKLEYQYEKYIDNKCELDIINRK